MQGPSWPPFLSPQVASGSEGPLPACLWTLSCARPSSVQVPLKQPNPGSGLGLGLPENIQDAVEPEFR